MAQGLQSYEAEARAILGENAPPGMFFDPMDPSDPRWEMNVRNMRALQDISLRPRVLRDVTTMVLSTEVLGQAITMPIMLAPSGFMNIYHDEAEVGVARAARSAGTVMVASTLSSARMETIACEAGGILWFQLYVQRDRGLSEHLIERAEAAGYSALVVTVDNLAVRPYEWDSRELRGEDGVFGNFDSSLYNGVPLSREEFGRTKAADFKWSEIDWLRSRTSLPIVIKGIQTVEDVILASQCGVDAVVVSNHGGHTTSVAGTIAMLPAIVENKGSLEVYFDGGVRSGSDVLKALALGARAVLIGRPMVWGLTVGGAAGVEAILAILREDLEVAMGLCGIGDIRDVSRRFVGLPGAC